MPPEVFPPEDVFDDFAIIAMQEAPAAKEDAGKSLKSFLRNITGGGSTPNTRYVKESSRELYSRLHPVSRKVS